MPDDPVACSSDDCGGEVEYRLAAINQDGNEGSKLFACGDGECVSQAIAYLLRHEPNINGVLIYEWVA